ncbi:MULTISPECIES: hypothetical protein [Bacillaceae]|uniref:DNA primase n=1 Tax=Evansella alkalicola TaxID=745819 RepID=A0ABS6JVQ2_9BACI|nr:MULTISPECIES: hypothetical protein [Bacillaceae]MBU9722631.1 hypothetical protein [Bacillus alkalicola]
MKKKLLLTIMSGLLAVGFVTACADVEEDPVDPGLEGDPGMEDDLGEDPGMEDDLDVDGDLD